MKKQTAPKTIVKNKNIVKKKQSSLKFFFTIGLVLVVLIILFFSMRKGSSGASQEEVDAFAKCLTDKGTIMYGTFWCPHCAKTKKMFGNSFRYVNYIECDPRGDNEQSELCLEKKIDKYDTWEFSDGTRFISEPSFEDLSARSGCPAPGAK